MHARTLRSTLSMRLPRHQVFAVVRIDDEGSVLECVTATEILPKRVSNASPDAVDRRPPRLYGDGTHVARDTSRAAQLALGVEGGVLGIGGGGFQACRSA